MACGIFQLWHVSPRLPDQWLDPGPFGARRLSHWTVREAPTMAYISVMSLNIGSTVLVIEHTLNKASFNDWLMTCSFLCQPEDFPVGSDIKESACNTGDPGLIPGAGSGQGWSPGEGNGNPLQYSCLENPMDRGAWWATVPGVARSWTRLSN